jgi:hypothetical protein
MSGWIRAGSGQLWHRVSELEHADAIARGEYRLLCGATLPTRAGWQDAVDELVPPDDQHTPCRNRALRETYWSGRIRSGNLVEIIGELVGAIAPELDRVTILPRNTRDGLWIFELRAANLSPVLAGAGRSPAAAVGDLLATVEARETRPPSDTRSN